MLVPTNGIQLDVTFAGPEDGELVVLTHGFPELGHSWRHQVPALAEAGYRVVVPDLRGYGRSDAPEPIEAYAIDVLARDVVGLIDHCGRTDALLIGHDWGADLAWKTALLHPDRVNRVACLSVPYIPPAPAEPTPIMRRHLGEDFYIVWFQEPGVAEAALGADVRQTLTTTKQWTPQWAAAEEDPPRPPFMTEEDVRTYVEAFERSGFRGPLNWYRNIDRNWRIIKDAPRQTIDQPAFFLTGSRDPAAKFMPAAAMEGHVTDLRDSVVIEGAGHWVNQERPEEVNAALLDFVDATASPSSGEPR